MIWDVLPRLAGRLIPSIISRGRQDSVYLTFDDGPDPIVTSKLSDKLSDLNCPATFFVTTSHVLTEKLLLIKLYNAGFTIGSHGHHHNSLLFSSFKKVSEDVNRSIQIINDCTGFRPTLFRPPFGKFNLNVLRVCSQQNMNIALWSQSANDWKPNAPGLLSQRIAKRTKPGDIILLHDRGLGADSTLKAIPSIVSNLRDNGFTLRALPLVSSKHV